MIDITLENFQTELIAASARTPVLLDIWAPWCGPCKQLGPVLEKLETAYAGRFVLAKLNSDEQPEIAGQLSQMFGVRSIPFCVMFAGGQPVDGFVGSIPEAQIREFLDKHVPSESELEAEADLIEAEDALAQGDAGGAEAKLQAALAADPANEAARLDLVKLLIEAGRVDEAKQVFLPVAGKATGPITDPRVLAFSHYLAAAQAAPQARPAATLQAAIAANKRDFDARFERAQALFGAGRFTDAMDELLEILMRDKAWHEDLARKTYVAVLEVMSKPAAKAAAPEAAKSTLEIAGKQAAVASDPVVDQYRRKLSMVLF